jgi:pimeloyl-ACP methyl ester carboxylesterase
MAVISPYILGRLDWTSRLCFSITRVGTVMLKHNLRGLRLVPLLATAWLCCTCQASEVLLKDGRVLKGKLGEAFGLAELQNASDPEGGHIKQIVFLDDDLRRTFISKRQIQAVRPEGAAQPEEKFRVRQQPAHGRATVKMVGPPAKPVEPFDDFGRRTFVMQTAKGPLPVIQAITEITPQWIKVEGVNYSWDMRMATSALPRDTLQKVLWRQIDPKNLEHRKRIARFYIQAERYEEAFKALEQIVTDFPEQTDVKQQLEPTMRELRQLIAKRLLAELKLRRAAGQHQLVQSLLGKFPSEDVAGEILQAVREMSDEYQALEAKRVEVLKDCATLVEQISDPAVRQDVAKINKELGAELGPETLPRMAALLQNLNDPQLTPDSKLALAASGWLLGADAATPNISAARSMYRVRRLVEKYLAEPMKIRRAKYLASLATEQSATPAIVGNMLTHMKTSPELPEPLGDSTPGYYKLEVAALPKEAPVTYYLQLPPECKENPYRRYPMIVTLNGLTATAEQEIDWWAGTWSAHGRMGQATRQGYIVLAPEWTVEHQDQYRYSAREHAIVLACMRDACRRFPVDSDRVFLSGHSMGGDAAWDIGLSHPDLWAGVIPIVAEAKRFCLQYWQNARSLPFYVVGGELDGGRLTRNAMVLDRNLRNGFNTTVVEYLGRGHENFSDESLRLFDWMGRFHRDFFPREFTCVSMRPWDNFFWWAEVSGLPPGSAVDPTNWPPPRGTQPVTIKGFMMANNSLNLRAGTSRSTVWLSPQMVDFNGRLNISVNGHRINTHGVAPSVETLLEDVRTRGDRQHPFWAKVEVPSGKGS